MLIDAEGATSASLPYPLGKHGCTLVLEHKRLHHADSPGRGISNVFGGSLCGAILAKMFSGVVPPDTAETSLSFAHPSDPGTLNKSPQLLSDSLRGLLGN